MFWQIKETHNLQGFAPQFVHHLDEKLLYYLNVANNFDSPSIEIQYHTGRKATFLMPQAWLYIYFRSSAALASRTRYPNCN